MGRQLRSALGHYARKGSGGGGAATRRLGSITKAGADLYEALSGEVSFAVPGGIAFEAPGALTINVTDLTGQSCELVIETIVGALTPDSGDADKIRAAMNHALVEALDGVEIFNPSYVTDDVIVNTMIGFLSESVFLQITMDGGKAWLKAESPHRATEAENELSELIKVVVDKHMAPKFAGKDGSFTNREMIQLQRQVIGEVWNEWEGFQ